MSAARLPRSHLIALAAIAAVGLFRGGFWVIATDVFSPIDEAQHYDYVRSMAEGDGPPVVGEDGLSSETRTVAKASSTGWWRAAALSAAADDDRWGSAGESYEGVQPPLYYAVLAPVYWLSRALWGALTTVFVLRVASTLLALLSIPAVYVLARTVFPSARAAWLVAPAVLVLVPGFNSNLGALTNDALVIPLGAAVLAATASSVRDGHSVRGAAISGVLFGLGALTKSTAIGLTPLVAVAAIAPAVSRGSYRRLLSWIAVAGGCAALVYLPWLIWNVVHYDAVSASEQVDAITGAFQAKVDVSLSGVWMHVRSGLNGFWDHQLSSPGPRRFSLLMSAIAGAMLAVGVGVALSRRRRTDAAHLLLLGSSAALCFLWMLFVIFVVFGGRSSVVGRHLYPALGALVVALATATVLAVGRVVAPVLLGVLLVPLAVHEVDDARRYLDFTYAWGTFEGRAPAFEQSFADDTRPGSPVAVRSPCSMNAIGLMFRDAPPAELRGTGGAGPPTGFPLVTVFTRPASSIGVYRLPTPARNVAIELDPAASLLVSSRERDERVDARAGDPALVVYCANRGADAVDQRFDQLFASAHPGWVTRRMMRAWAGVSFALVTVVIAALSAAALWSRRRRERAAANGA